MRTRSRDDSASLEDVPETPDIEFTMLDPLTSSDMPPRSFAEVRLSWLATLCAPDIFAQGQQCYLAKRVTRVHAHGMRMTGTISEKRFEDQEILLQDGKLFATCTCEGAPALTVSTIPVQGDMIPGTRLAQNPDAGRTLRCRHVVAIMLAYLQTPIGSNSNGPERPSQTLEQAQALKQEIQEKLVCPVTRQKLEPKQAFYQCSRCGMCYSTEGWEFLRTADKGRCCGCESRKTIKQAPTK